MPYSCLKFASLLIMVPTTTPITGLGRCLRCINSNYGTSTMASPWTAWRWLPCLGRFPRLCLTLIRSWSAALSEYSHSAYHTLVYLTELQRGRRQTCNSWLSVGGWRDSQQSIHQISDFSGNNGSARERGYKSPSV